MQSFQERFKYKSSTIGKGGDIDIRPTRAIIKPNESQLHSPVIKSSAKAIIESQYSEKLGPNKIPTSASSSVSPKKRNVSPRRQVSQAPPISLMGPLDDPPMLQQRFIEFVPYTITDYNFIKPGKYYELGGLGSPTIGTEEWVKRKHISDKRKQYAKQILITDREPVSSAIAAEKVKNSKGRSAIHTRNSTSLT